jgi:hypothetical protein
MKRKANDCPDGQYGPVYNVTGAGLAGYRKAAQDGLAGLDREARQQYGAMVGEAVLAMQHNEAQRAIGPEQRSSCASGTWHSDGAAIHDAIRGQQHRALMSWPAKCRSARTAHEWETGYEEAMEAKAAAIAERLLAGQGMWELAA